MNSTRTLLLSFVAVPLLCASIAPADKLAFHPAEGASVSRAWALRSDFTLEDMEMTMNGAPSPVDLQMEMNMSMSSAIEVSDKFVSLRDGAPKELLRTYDKLNSSGSFKLESPVMPDGGKESAINAASELEGKTVKFLWDEENGKYECTFHESEGDAKLLENLAEDMDLRGVLPSKEVAEGDTWEVDVNSLRGLMVPGGDLKLRPTDTGEEGAGDMMPGMDNMGDFAGMMGDLLEGEAKAEYKGVKEVDGSRYGEIHLTAKAASNNDMSAKMSDMIKEKGLPEGLDALEFDHMDIEIEVETEGTILWDLVGGFIHAIDMSGTMTMSSDTAMKIETMGQKFSMEYQMTLSGTLTTQLAVTKN